MNARQKAKKLKKEVDRLQAQLKKTPFQVNIIKPDVVTVRSVRTISRIDPDREFVKNHLARDISLLLLREGLISFKEVDDDYDGCINVQATAFVIKKVNK